MELFLGTYNYNIDEKKRLRLPSKFKDILGKEVVITATDNNELSLMKAEQFQTQITKMISSTSSSREKQRNMIKLVTSRSVEIKVDASGRILIPDEMIEFSGIQKEVVVLGWGDRIGITSKSNHEKNIAALEEKETIKEGIESFEELFIM